MTRISVGKIVVPILMVIIIIITLSLTGDKIGFDSSIATEITVFLPSIVCFIVGMRVLTSGMGDSFSFGAIGLIGVGVAYLMQALDDGGYVTTQMSGGLTIIQIQIITIVMFLMLGAAVSFKGRR